MVLLDLLFSLNEWLALAKLRIHTESTLKLLETSTTVLGQELRRFVKKVCNRFDTRELPKEEAARGRRAAQMLPAGGINSIPGKLSKKLNLNTYKVHALGDYANTIRHFGTTDSYSTQLVSDT